MMMLRSDYAMRRACFTENYLIFSLNERMPQITELYLDKEDDVLDYCKRVVFTTSANGASPEAESPAVR